ncbi:hypothetical protein [Lysobacter gummosus]|uniref:hypothetical protein n=1 Tax=Lysobacter gummosus TaxID=262324 RepID=UPI003627F4EC
MPPEKCGRGQPARRRWPPTIRHWSKTDTCLRGLRRRSRWKWGVGSGDLGFAETQASAAAASSMPSPASSTKVYLAGLASLVALRHTCGPSLGIRGSRVGAASSAPDFRIPNPQSRIPPLAGALHEPPRQRLSHR